MFCRTKYDRNAETLMTISDVLAVEGGTLPSLQLKMTAFMPAELLVSLLDLALVIFSMRVLSLNLI